MTIATHEILGVRVSMVDYGKAVSLAMQNIAARRRMSIVCAGVHSVMEAHDDPAYRAILNAAELCVPDGMPMVWIGRAAGKAVDRVFGPDLMLHLSAALAARGGSAFYYGGGPGVAEDLAGQMERRYPGLRTAGALWPPCHEGTTRFRPLSDDDLRRMAAEINASGADVVWCGLGTPMQEKWIARMRPLLDAPVLAGVGAAFDYNSGRTRRAPRWMQRCALEWLYRTIQEPRRLWRRYARNNPRFVWLLMKERLGSRRAGR